MITLTIAIPTYNRPEALARTVRCLLPQLIAGVDLVVIDNHSQIPATTVLKSLLAEFPGAACSIVRNRINIGGNANILRCFEHGEGDWLWTLGDDDTPVANAVAIIIDAIRTAQQADQINFCTTIQPTREAFEVASVDEFLHRCDSIGNSFFISANIYRRERFEPYLASALNHTDTNIPQLVLLLAALGEGGVARFSNKLIIKWAVTEDCQRWPHYYFFQFLELARVLPTYRQQQELLRLLDFAVAQFTPIKMLRWAVLSQYNHAENPSALLFTARCASLRALLTPSILVRLRWRGVEWAATTLHRHQSAFVRLWSCWHRVRHRKDLQPKPYPGAYRGQYLHACRHVSDRDKAADCP